MTAIARVIRAFGHFWWDFLVGDTPELAVATAALVGLAFLLAGPRLVGAILLPLVAAAFLFLSTYRGRRRAPRSWGSTHSCPRAAPAPAPAPAPGRAFQGALGQQQQRRRPGSRWRRRTCRGGEGDAEELAARRDIGGHRRHAERDRTHQVEGGDPPREPRWAPGEGSVALLDPGQPTGDEEADGAQRVRAPDRVVAGSPPNPTSRALRVRPVEPQGAEQLDTAAHQSMRPCRTRSSERAPPRRTRRRCAIATSAFCRKDAVVKRSTR